MIDRQVFPYFGGKGRVATEVWRRLGRVDGYLEPFAGSLAMALRNPHSEALKSETVNDLDPYVANFWRAVSQAPDVVASWADAPVSQIELTVRHEWLDQQRDRLRLLLLDTPDAFDPKVAGWWVWGISIWIGSGYLASNKKPGPHLGQRPHLGHHGMGVHSLGQRPHLGHHGMGGVYDLYRQIAQRLRFTRVVSCDWKSLRSTLHTGCSTWGVFLDPPYTARTGRCPSLYTAAGPDSQHLTLGDEVATWAREIGHHHRVALCGIAGEYEMPGWDVFDWKTTGFSMGNRDRAEVIWFSPACVRPSQAGLFDALAAPPVPK